MAQDHNDIYSIVEKLAILEGRLTPTSVKHGLNSQQRSVPQMPALFKPKTQKILGGDADAKNPMSGYMVGSDESAEPNKEMVEDVLDKVKRSFTDFIKNVEDEIKDSDIKDKKSEDTDLKKKEKKDRDLVSKTVDESPEIDDEEDQEDLPSDYAYQRGENPYDAPEPQVESAPVKTLTNECGLWEMHGNERDGFEVRRGGRSLPTRFKDLDEAQMAVEMFAHRRRKADESQDYMEER
jgi:hypothetical protein